MKRIGARTVLAAALLLCFVVPAQATDLSGYWSMNAFVPDLGGASEYWLINQTGANLDIDRSACSSCDNSTATGTVSGSQVTVTLLIDDQMVTVTGTLVNVNRIRGDIGNGGWFEINRASDTLCQQDDVIERFVENNYIELDTIGYVSKFRSGAGHDYSDMFECCRSMKHYFVFKNGVDRTSVKIFSPVAGTLVRLETERMYGSRVEIQSELHPHITFVIFHITPVEGLQAGDLVAAGQQLGQHAATETNSDIAVRLSPFRYISFFEVMSDSLFAAFQARGMNSREEAIITQEERDANPLSCNGEEFVDGGTLENWVYLN